MASRLSTESLARGSARRPWTVIIRSESLTVDDGDFRQIAESTFDSIVGRGVDIVESGEHYYMSGDESPVSQDRHTTIVPITMAVDVPTAGDNIGEVHDVVMAANDQREFEVLLTRQSTVALDAQEISKTDVETGESIANPIAMIILVLVPAAMALHENPNWYPPRWREWLPEIRVEVEQAQPDTAPGR